MAQDERSGAEDIDRPTGALNRRMRAYLTQHPESEIEIGEKTQAERNLRAAIRDRVKNALFDFILLTDAEQFKWRDLKQTVQKGDETIESEGFRIEQEAVAEEGRPEVEIVWDEEEPVVDQAIETALIEMVVFLYRATSRMTGRAPQNWFTYLIEKGTEEAYARFKSDAVLYDVDLKIDASRRETARERAAYKMEQGKELTPKQVQILLESDQHSDEDIGEYVRRFQEPAPDE